MYIYIHIIYYSLSKGKKLSPRTSMNRILAGGFKYLLFIPPNLGEIIQIEEHIFQMGW